MKKVYMPTMDELYQMQDLGADVEKYLLVKAIESLALEGRVLTARGGIFKLAYKYLRENPEIAYAICRMYPEEIKYSEIAQNDIRLLWDLLGQSEKPQDASGKQFYQTIYDLDNLAHFEHGAGMLMNQRTVRYTIEELDKKLPKVPEYRFDYRPNSLLDNIFSCNLPIDTINRFIYKLTKIEPGYALKVEKQRLDKEPIGRKAILREGMKDYIKRYGIEITHYRKFEQRDILTNPDTNVKRLLKCIKEHKI